MEFEPILDVFGKSTNELLNKKLFLFDMDGTIYNEDVVFKGTRELLGFIDYIGGKYVFLTNNSSKSVKDYSNKLNSMDIPVCEENFYTSTQATIRYIKNNFGNRLMYCQGTKSFINELIQADIQVTEEVDDNIGAVVVGFDTEISSEKIRKTCNSLQMDVPFIATNPDLRCPVSFGFIPDCGAICNMITAATDKRPIYIGKPQPVMVYAVCEQYGYSYDDAVIIGDRLYTDIATGINAGITSVCVLTGEATRKEILESDIMPTLTFESVNEIYLVLAQFNVLKASRHDHG